MSTPEKLLRDHPLYGLDQAIVGHLAPCLERQFGEPFRRYHLEENALMAAAVETTVKLAPKLAGRTLRQQEDILPRPPHDPELADAWQALLALVHGEWRDLCLLYTEVRSELRDLSCMAAAQRAAEESGGPAHATRVRRLLALDTTLAPAWLPVG